jgi:hypothetical protein
MGLHRSGGHDYDDARSDAKGVGNG